MQKEFKDIYYQFIGVLAVSDCGVQVDDELFLQNFKEFKVEKDGYKYPIKIKKNYNGTEFFTIMDTEELEGLKEKNPRAYEKIKEEWGKLDE